MSSKSKLKKPVKPAEASKNTTVQIDSRSATQRKIEQPNNSATNPTIRDISDEARLLKSFDLQSAAEYLSHCSNVIVMCGAGLSNSAGVPDFRASNTELNSKLSKYKLPFPEAIFEMNYFRENPKPFFLLAKEFYSGNFKPTPAHYFIRLLNEKGKLLRVFTQNIDSLERISGIPKDKIVEVHGSFFTAHCMKCNVEYSRDRVRDTVLEDEVPYCDICKGVIKPDIVFFGEDLPSTFMEYVQNDFPMADFLLIMGTSLQVAPFNTLIARVGKNCPRLLINLEPAGVIVQPSDNLSNKLMFDSPDNRRDVFHRSTCDDGVAELVKLLGWENGFARLFKINETSSHPSKIITFKKRISRISTMKPPTSSQAAAVNIKKTSSPFKSVRRNVKKSSPSPRATAKSRQRTISPTKSPSRSTVKSKSPSSRTTNYTSKTSSSSKSKLSSRTTRATTSPTRGTRKTSNASPLKFTPASSLWTSSGKASRKSNVSTNHSKISSNKPK